MSLPRTAFPCPPSNVAARPPPQREAPICHYFLQGRCAKAELCSFRHERPAPQPKPQPRSRPRLPSGGQYNGGARFQAPPPQPRKELAPIIIKRSKPAPAAAQAAPAAAAVAAAPVPARQAPAHSRPAAPQAAVQRAATAKRPRPDDAGTQAAETKRPIMTKRARRLQREREAKARAAAGAAPAATGSKAATARQNAAVRAPIVTSKKKKQKKKQGGQAAQPGAANAARPAAPANGSKKPAAAAAAKGGQRQPRMASLSGDAGATSLPSFQIKSLKELKGDTKPAGSAAAAPSAGPTFKVKSLSELRAGSSGGQPPAVSRSNSGNYRRLARDVLKLPANTATKVAATVTSVKARPARSPPATSARSPAAVRVPAQSPRVAELSGEALDSPSMPSPGLPADASFDALLDDELGGVDAVDNEGGEEDFDDLEAEMMAMDQ